jgi:uncharacterized protein
MRFWDSSALVPVAVLEAGSSGMRGMVESDPVMVVWWAARVECEAAVARRRREGFLSAAGEGQARRALERIFQVAGEVAATDGVGLQAVRLVRVHALRAADALQLAAALVWADGTPAARELVTLDQRLATAASQEGFAVRGDVT